MTDQVQDAENTQEAQAPQVVEIPQQHAEMVERIVSFTNQAFNVPFEFTIVVGDMESLWLVGPFGTFAIALGVSTSPDGSNKFNAISVSLDADPHFAAVTTHSFANEFGLVYMEPHAAGNGAQEGQILFGDAGFQAFSLRREAQVRARLVELATEAGRSQATLEDQSQKLFVPPKELVDTNGRVLK